MKRFLSWIVYFAFHNVFTSLSFALISLLFLLFDWLGDKSIGLCVLISIVAGASLIGLAILPFTIGVPYAIKQSENICPSRNGLRYSATAIIVIVLSLLAGIGSLIFDGSFDWKSLFFLAFNLIYLFINKQ